MKDITVKRINEIAAEHGITVEQVAAILKSVGKKVYTHRFDIKTRDGKIDQVFLKDTEGRIFSDGYEMSVEDVIDSIEHTQKFESYYKFDASELAEFDTDVYDAIDTTKRFANRV